MFTCLPFSQGLFQAIGSDILVRLGGTHVVFLLHIPRGAAGPTGPLGAGSRGLGPRTGGTRQHRHSTALHHHNHHSRSEQRGKERLAAAICGRGPTVETQRPLG